MWSGPCIQGNLYFPPYMEKLYLALETSKGCGGEDPADVKVQGSGNTFYRDSLVF